MRRIIFTTARVCLIVAVVFLAASPQNRPQPIPPMMNIFEAAQAGDLGRIRTLVENDPNIVHSKDAGGRTPLYVAVGFNRLEAAEYLISKGADVNARNNLHTAPLHAACGNKLPFPIVRLLVENGADVNAIAKYSGKPLDLAEDAGNSAVIAYLKSRGATTTPHTFETVRLAENIHRIAFPWGMRNNVIVFSGPEGTLVIDSGFSKSAAGDLGKEIARLAKGPIKFIINSHLHGDHVDGNSIAPPEAKIIDAKNIKSFGFAKSDQPFGGPAGKTLAAPYVLRFNGEEIRIIPHPGLHSPEDLLIYFPKSGVLCLGDLLLSQNCPAVSDVSGYLEFLDAVLKAFPAGTIFVSGHGKDLTSDGLKKYRDDHLAMIAIVRKNIEAGKTVEEMVSQDILKAYKAEYSFLDWIGPDSLIPRIRRK